MDRRNFLKLTGVAAATLPVMGMPSFGGINRKPLPSEQQNLSTPGYIHSKDCFNFIQCPDEFQKGDLWIDPKDHIIYVYTPCTGQALYSILKEEWRVNCYDFSDEDLIQYLFPLVAITAQMFETQGDWTIVGLQHLRNCGLHITKTDEMYAGIVALGQTLETTHMTVNDFRFPYPGPINSLVPISDQDPESLVFSCGDQKCTLRDYGADKLLPCNYYIPVYETIKIEDHYG